MFIHPRGRHGGPRRGGRSWGPFSVEWSIGDDAERGRGRGRRKFDGGELRLVLLKLIEEAPRHGYDLIREIEDRTGGAYAPSPGVVYPTLTMLGDMGHIEEQQSEGARKRFAITAEGGAHLAAHADEVAMLFERLRALGEMRQRTDGAPIRRAMRNLKQVLHDRLSREDADDDRLYAVAAILDDAAQKIERLA